MIIALLGIFLNFSQVIYGINVSFADILLILLIIKKVVKKEFIIKTKMFLLIFIAFLYRWILTIILIVDLDIQFSGIEIFVDAFKVLIAVSFLLVGNMLDRNEWDILLRCFIYTSTIIGLMTIVQIIFQTGALSFLTFGSTRAKGLMNDPNYFSLIQIIAYILSEKRIKSNRIFMKLILITSSLFSGSKMAALTLIFSILVKLILNKKYHKKRNIVTYTVIMLSIVFNKVIQQILTNISFNIYSLERIREFLVNKDINSGGSSRGLVWENSINIIKKFNGMGMGFGMYLPISEKFEGLRMLAHNTFLQFVSEWGLIISITFYLIVLILVIANYKEFKADSNKLVLLLSVMFYSMSISMINSRIFWLFISYIFTTNKVTELVGRDTKNIWFNKSIMRKDKNNELSINYYGDL